MTSDSQSNDIEVYSNENLTVEVSRLPQCALKLDIRVAKNAAEACYVKSIKAVSHEISIPGFRKGKAPQEIIRSKYGSFIQKEFMDLALKTALKEALALASIHFVKDSFTKSPVVYVCTPEQVHFMVECESQPKIPYVNLNDISLKKILPKKITERHCQRALQLAIDSMTTFSKAEHLNVQEGDYVDCEITEITSNHTVSYQRMKVSPILLPDWLYETLLGLQHEEKIEGKTRQDPDFDDDPELDYSLKVTGIWIGKSPAIDDELAKTMGASSVPELYELINKRLEKEAEESVFHEQVSLLENFLLQNYSFELPKSYVEAEKQTRLEKHLTEVKKTKASYDKQSYSQLMLEIDNASQAALQLFFLFGKIAADYGLVADSDDISNEFATLQMNLIRSGKSPLKNLPSDQELYNRLASVALDRKLRHFLIAHATLV